MSITRIAGATVWTGLRDPRGEIITSDAVAFSEVGVVALGEAAKRLSVDVQIDAGGGFVLPAFGDGHVHTINGGLRDEMAPVAEA